MNMRNYTKRGSHGVRFVISTSIVAFAVLGVSRSARATIIVPAPSGITTVTPGNIPGLPNVNDSYITSETEPFIGYNAQNIVVFQGTVESWVFADPSEPSFGGQPGLDFVYQLTNNVDGDSRDDPIDRLTVSSFATYQTDVNYIGGTGNVAPTTADRSAIPGSIVGFNFPTGAMVAPGQNSDQLVVATDDVTTPVQGIASVIDGGSGYTGAEAPVAAVILTVPEPATFGLLALAGGMLLGRRRR